MTSMTFGVMPTREQFDAGWDACEPRGDRFHFGNDKRIGNDALTQEELWKEVVKAHGEFEEGDEDAGDWCSSVLGCLDIEWI